MHCSLAGRAYDAPHIISSMDTTPFRRFRARRVYGWCLDEACGWDGGDCCENTCISAELDCGSRNYFCLDPNEERSPYASCEGIGVGTWIADGFCDEHNNNEGKKRYYLAHVISAKQTCFLVT